MKEYRAIDVARYVIYYCILRNIAISNLKLQKLLYFIQAFYLVRFGRPCFRDAIQAWDFGPVVPSVYHAFKQYGAGNIPYVIPEVYDVTDRISPLDRGYISAVLDTFAKYSATELVEATHHQDPWKNVYTPGRHDIVITNKSIKEYFDGIFKQRT